MNFRSARTSFAGCISGIILSLFTSASVRSQTSYFSIGTASGVNDNIGGTAFPCPLPDYWEVAKQQYLFLASELTASGMTAGDIVSIRWNIISMGNTQTIESYGIKMGLTSTNSLAPGLWEATPFTARPSSNYTPVAGQNVFTINPPFTWDGTSNIVMEVCNGVQTTSSTLTASANPNMAYTTLPFNGSRMWGMDNFAVQCALSPGGNGSINPADMTKRPVTEFGMLINCSGVPNAGNTLSSLVTSETDPACSNRAVTLSLSVPEYVGYSYQWQFSADSLNWTDISGANSYSYLFLTATSPYYYRCMINCSISSSSAASVPVHVFSGPCTNIPTGNPANGSQTTCLGRFYDDGSSQNNYNFGQNSTYTYNAVPGKGIRVRFLSFNTEGGTDILKIYNGSNTSSPLIATLSGNLNANLPGPFVSDTGVALTFNFVSNNNTQLEGWEAIIDCVEACSGVQNPGDTRASLTGICSGSQVNFSLSNPGILPGVSFQWQKSTTGIPASFTNINGATGAVYSATLFTSGYYRCRVSCAPSSTGYFSTPVFVNVHDCSSNTNVNISNTTTTGCAFNFYDSGGPAGNYQSNENYTHTFYPPPGNRLIVIFNSFSTEPCTTSPCDYLRIHDGNSVAAPLVGEYRGANLPPPFTSTAADGSLTFFFHSDGAANYFGWTSMILCTLTETCSSVPTVNITGNLSVCVGNPDILHAAATSSNGPIAAYQWLLNGSLIPGATSDSLQITDGGDYAVTVYDSTGCNTTSQLFHVNGIPSPEVSLSGMPAFCAGDSILLSAIAVPGSGTITGYQWQMNGTNIPGADTDSYYVSQGGSYALVVTNSNGCTVLSDSFIITEDQNPVANFTYNSNGLTVDFSGTPQTGVTYSWDFGDGSPVENGMNPVHIFLNSGSYTVTLTVTNTCGTTSISQTIQVVTGISEMNAITDFRLFPNPASHVITIEFSVVKQADPLQVEIAAMTGGVILKETLTSGVNRYRKEMDVSGFAKGNYVIRIISGEVILNKKIIKIR